MIYYCDVILPLSLARLYTYHLADENLLYVKPGYRVIVEFGKKKLYTAIVCSVHHNKPEEYETKPILSVLDNHPIVTSQQINLWEWISSYYMCSLGEVYKSSLPSGLKLESETRIFLNMDFMAEKSLAPKEEEILNILSNHGTMTVHEINHHISVKNAYPYLKSLLNMQAISTEELINKSYKPKTETFISINPKYLEEEELNQLFVNLKRAVSQQKLLMAFLSMVNTFDNTAIKEVKKGALLDYAQTSQVILKELIKKDILREEQREISRIPRKEAIYSAKQLTGLQNQILQQIILLFKTKNTILLHGVTSSGKTEIYIHLIKKYLDMGKQVLYLLPEIALTTQIINRLQNVFGAITGVYHSKFGDHERVEIYNRVLKKAHEENAIRLVLGVRSSVFLPFHNLGLIIVDEEHENTYKQYDPAPRYHARDTAIYLATIHRANVLLGTATPSIESYYNAKTGKYGLVELFERFQNIELPQVIISNTKEAYRKKQMKSLFTPLMLDQIKTSLDKKEQVILFKNRRGYSPYVECNTCNWIPYCKNCDVTLTYHRKDNQLTCHYCGYSRSIPATCDVCGQPAIQTRGYGTEKIEDELSVFFPEAKIQRLDLDTSRSKKSYEKIIGDFENKEIDILVGTQMISKGLDFDNVSLVGILNADNMLNYPDFRAHERSYQLMAQVSGRAGRKNKRGKVVIQVSDEGHPVIHDVIYNNYKNLFIKQLDERKTFRYPPFYRLILLKVKHKDKNIVSKASYLLAQRLFHYFGDRVAGPEFPLVERVQNLFQKNILVKLEAEKSGNKAKKIIINTIHELLMIEDYKNIRVVIDVDPM